MKHGAPRLEQTPAWQTLRHMAQRFPSNRLDGVTQANSPTLFDLRRAFDSDPQRVQRFSQSLHDAQGELLHVDFSKAHVDAQAMQGLLDLASQQQVGALRDAMFAGEAINTTEARQVMHWLLRMPDDSQVGDALQPAWQSMQAVRKAFLGFARQVRADDQLTDVVNIGIGGSDLGPRMAVQALQAHTMPGKRFHFVSNVDGHELHQVLRQIEPHRTLFIVASKTFSTQETMTNARSALDWFAARGGRDVARHFVGITTNLPAAEALGIRTTFGFWDWVGGRYSIWSAIGLTLAIAIGPEAFAAFLAGAHAVDEHFRLAPPQDNLPLKLGLLDAWYVSLLGYNSRSIAPYHADMQRLPAYLQQLEMESNGKGVTRHGVHAGYATAPVVWGEPGTNGQHAFFQLLHQGTRIVPVEFMAVRSPSHDLPHHHTLLLANALAQAQALMLGRAHADAQRCCFGNRPSTFMLLPELSPRTLGALLALYEHRVFVSGALWDINSFDQFGVELGKQLAQDIAPRFASGHTQGLDPSTADLLRRLRSTTD